MALIRLRNEGSDNKLVPPFMLAVKKFLPREKPVCEIQYWKQTVLQLKEHSSGMYSQSTASIAWPRGGTGHARVKGSTGTGPAKPGRRSVGWHQEDSTADLEAAKGKSHSFSSQEKSL